MPIKLPVAGSTVSKGRRAVQTANAGDVQTVNPGILRDPGVQVPAPVDSGIEDLGAVVEDVGTRFLLAEENARKRDESVRRALLLGQLNEFSNQQIIDAELNGSLIQLGGPEALADAIREKREELSGQIEDPDSLARFTIRSEEAVGGFTDSIASMAVKGRRKLALDTLGSELKALSNSAIKTDIPLAALLNKAREIGDDADPSIFPRDTREKDAVLKAGILKGRLERHLFQRTRTSLEVALDILNEKRFEHILLPSTQVDFRQRIRAAQTGEKASDVKGIPRDIFDALGAPQQLDVLGIGQQDDIKGIPRNVFDGLTEPEQKRVLGAAPDERSIKGIPEDIFNALPKDVQQSVLTKPLVSIQQTQETELSKALGKADAETVTKTESDARLLENQTAQLDATRAALNSGKFETGAFGEVRLSIARLAEFIGAGQNPAIQKLFGDSVTADVIDAAAKSLAVEEATKLSRVTNMSLGFIRDKLPALFRSREGNLILVEIMERVRDRKREEADLMAFYVNEFGSLRPKGKDPKTGKKIPSFVSAFSKFNRENPVIDDELLKRIAEGSKAAPKSFKDLFDKLPPGMPEGSKRNGELTEDGLEVFVTPDGKRMVNDPGDAK